MNKARDHQAEEWPGKTLAVFGKQETMRFSDPDNFDAWLKTDTAVSLGDWE